MHNFRMIIEKLIARFVHHTGTWLGMIGFKVIRTINSRSRQPFFLFCPVNLRLEILAHPSTYVGMFV